MRSATDCRQALIRYLASREGSEAESVWQSLGAALTDALRQGVE